MTRLSEAARCSVVPDASERAGAAPLLSAAFLSDQTAAVALDAPLQSTAQAGARFAGSAR